MIKKILTAFAVLICFAWAFTSCKKDPSTNSNSSTDPYPIPSNYIRLGETYILGAKVKAVVYSNANLTTGYNLIYVAFYDSIDNKRQVDGHFSINPIMDMGTMQHGAPYEPMDEIVTTTNGLYSGAVVFTMPSSQGNTWILQIAYHNHRYDLEGEGELTLSVAQSSVPRMYFLNNTPDSQNLVAALIQPFSPTVGLNNFEIGIYRKYKSDYLPDSSYTISINPQMLSMGHGSNNNVNPIATYSGHYLGKVNFTMTGSWRVFVSLQKNGTLIDDKSYFDITP